MTFPRHDNRRFSAALRHHAVAERGRERAARQADTLARELNLRNRILDAFMDTEGPRAFKSMLEAMAAEFPFSFALLALVDAQDEMDCFFPGKREPAHLGHEEWTHLFGPFMSEPGIQEWRDCVLPLDSGPSAWAISFRIDFGTGTGGLFCMGSPTACPAQGKAMYASFLHRISPLFEKQLLADRESLVRSEALAAIERSSRQVNVLMENLQDIVFTIATDGTVVRMSEEGKKLLAPDGAIGKPAEGLFVNSEDYSYFMGRLDREGTLRNLEILFRAADGSPIYVVVSAVALEVDGHRECIVMGQNVTDRIRNEQLLWKANLELGEANQKLRETQMLMIQHEKLASLGSLAAGIAHEINNPLGFVKSNVSTIGRYLRTFRDSAGEAVGLPGIADIWKRHGLDFLFADTDALLLETEDGVGRISDIVASLRSFSRTDSGTVPEPFDLNECIRSTLVVARNQVKYVADVKLDLGELPRVPGFPNQMNQVLLNIIVNAAQAIASQHRAEHGTITIRTMTLERKGQPVVRCEIADDGPGIPFDQQLLIFDPFYTTKPPGEGTGLGLSISWDIVVNKHGGSLQVESTQDGAANPGATFIIELPATSGA